MRQRKYIFQDCQVGCSASGINPVGASVQLSVSRLLPSSHRLPCTVILYCGVTTAQCVVLRSTINKFAKLQNVQHQSYPLKNIECSSCLIGWVGGSTIHAGSSPRTRWATCERRRRKQYFVLQVICPCTFSSNSILQLLAHVFSP